MIGIAYLGALLKLLKYVLYPHFILILAFLAQVACNFPLYHFRVAVACIETMARPMGKKKTI